MCCLNLEMGPESTYFGLRIKSAHESRGTQIGGLGVQSCLGSVDRQTDRQARRRSAAYLGVLDLQLREGNEVLLEVLYPPRLEVLDF